MEQHRIAGDRLAVVVKQRGAELISISHAEAGEVLWQAGPAWPKHAPVLFPIVGELPDGRYHLDGREYEMGRHGFARDSDFTWVDTGVDACTLLLEDNDRTRAMYPFSFALEIRYAIERDTLIVTYTVRNTGTRPLPASLGAHPAFRWPIVDGVPKETHTLTFAQNEPEPIRRLRENLLDPIPQRSPIRGRVLPLAPALFDADAIVMDRPHSKSVRFGAPGTPAIDVAWKGFAQLGIWSKRGGDFVCIEPWFGYASPLDFKADFVHKPGLMYVTAGASKTFQMRVTVTA